MPKTSNQDLLESWKNVPNLWATPFTEILGVWDSLDGKGTYPAAQRALARTDRFYLLIKVLNRIDAWHPWVYARCREVEANPDGYIDIWAREHFKSTIITFAGGIQDMLKDAELCTGIFSHTKHIAKGFLAQIQRELEANEKLKALFPDILYSDPAKESPSWSLDNGLIVKRQSNPKECTFEAHGLVDGQPTSKHFPKLIYDDVVTLESVSTPEQVQKTTKAWELSDNLGTANGRKQIVGTRYDYGDTYAKIMERGRIRTRIYPATDDGTITGKPVLFTRSQLERKLIDQGEATFSSQMLCNPLAGHQRMFNVTDLEDYEIRPETLSVYIIVDPARSKKKDSANTAMVVIGMDYAGNKYLLDGFDHKMKLQERWDNMRNLWAKWRIETGIVNVNVGYEKFGAQSDMDYFEERRLVEHLGITIQELEWPNDGPGSKIDRVQRLGPDFAKHRFYLPYNNTEHPGKITKDQQRMKDGGYGYRIAKPIKRHDENGQIYDLAERFKAQVHYFPFGGLKDLVDAASRIYDMSPTPPTHDDESMLEPEVV
jgi:hypothetical protein